MLVVVAIILILAGMLFPVFEAALAKAESASCLSNMRNLGMAIRLYCDDHDGVLIPAMLPHPTEGRISWEVTLQPYVNNRPLLICPGDDYPRELPGALSLPHSYGLNLALTEVGGYMGSSMSIVNIDDPIATILLCELNGQRVATHGVRYETGWDERVAILRHGGGANYTFVDGHAKRLRPEATEAPDLLWDP